MTVNSRRLRGEDANPQLHTSCDKRIGTAAMGTEEYRFLRLASVQVQRVCEETLKTGIRT